MQKGQLELVLAVFQSLTPIRWSPFSTLPFNHDVSVFIIWLIYQCQRDGSDVGAPKSTKRLDQW